MITVHCSNIDRDEHLSNQLRKIPKQTWLLNAATNLVGEGKCNPDYEEEEGQHKVGQSNAVPRRMIDGGPNATGIIHQNHYLHQNTRNIVQVLKELCACLRGTRKNTSQPLT